MVSMGGSRRRFTTAGPQVAGEPSPSSVAAKQGRRRATSDGGGPGWSGGGGASTPGLDLSRRNVARGDRSWRGRRRSRRIRTWSTVSRRARRTRCCRLQRATSRSSVPFFSHGAASACAAAHEQKYVVTPLHVPARWADGGACHPAPARSVQVRPGARAPPARRVPDQGQRRLPSAVENRLDTTAFT